jgi:hypothetical protein
MVTISVCGGSSEVGWTEAVAADTREAETEAEGEVCRSWEVELNHEESQGNHRQARAGENRSGQSSESQQKWTYVTETSIRDGEMKRIAWCGVLVCISPLLEGLIKDVMTRTCSMHEETIVIKGWDQRRWCSCRLVKSLFLFKQHIIEYKWSIPPCVLNLGTDAARHLASFSCCFTPGVGPGCAGIMVKVRILVSSRIWILVIYPTASHCSG